MLITKIREKGIHIELAGENLRCIAVDGTFTDEQIQWLKDHKQALIAEIKAMESEPPPLTEEDKFDLAEAQAERSAICEYEGGMSRKEADAEAAKVMAWSVLVKMPQADDRAPRWITMISHGTEPEARRDAENFFTQQRVLSIRATNRG